MPRLGLHLVLLALLLKTFDGRAAPDAARFTNFGPQLTSRTFQAAAFTRDRSGRDLLCVTIRGDPSGKLVLVDPSDGAVGRVFALGEAGGAWGAVTARDGSVYFGTAPNGKVFRFIPGENAVRDLGPALPGETYVWDLAVSEQGEVFGGTYPGGRVFRYTPADGFTDIVGQPIAAGATYARSVAFDDATRTLYVGTGVKTPGLVEIDVASGRGREWSIPERFAAQQSVYQLFLAGDWLFAMIYPLQRTLVFDRPTRRVVAEIETRGHYEFISPPSPRDGTIYFISDAKLERFDPRRREAAPAGLGGARDPRAMAWLGETPSLVMFTQDGELLRHDPAAGATERIDVPAPEEPTTVQSLVAGPDGRVWIGGYLAGGAAAFDPSSGHAQQFKGISQAESIEVIGHKIYFGLYPRGRIHEFDTGKPWSRSGDDANPRQVAILPEQSRPIAMLGVPELGKLFVGTIPEYGRLGGTLAVWDVAARELETFSDLVPRQSIASLEFAGGFVVAGTTVQGGLGVQPTETEARLFLWDPATKKKIFETVPVAERRIVSGLTARPDGTVWGFAEGALFVFDIKTRTITHADGSFRPNFSDRAMWQDAAMIAHPDGDLYAIEHDRFLHIDGRTRKITVLRDGIQNKHTRPIAMDRAGRIYFADGADLWRYEP